MKDEGGFSLIEVLAATAVLLVVLLGAAAMSLAAYGNLQRSGEQTVAAELTQQHLEWLRNQGYGSTDLAAGTTTVTLGGDYAGYARTTTVSADTPRAGVKQITVIMSMPSGVSTQATALISE